MRPTASSLLLLLLTAWPADAAAARGHDEGLSSDVSSAVSRLEAKASSILAQPAPTDAARSRRTRRKSSATASAPSAALTAPTETTQTVPLDKTAVLHTTSRPTTTAHPHHKSITSFDSSLPSATATIHSSSVPLSFDLTLTPLPTFEISNFIRTTHTKPHPKLEPIPTGKFLGPGPGDGPGGVCQGHLKHHPNEHLCAGAWDHVHTETTWDAATIPSTLIMQISGLTKMLPTPPAGHAAGQHPAPEGPAVTGASKAPDGSDPSHNNIAYNPQADSNPDSPHASHYTGPTITATRVPVMPTAAASNGVAPPPATGYVLNLPAASGTAAPYPAAPAKHPLTLLPGVTTTVDGTPVVLHTYAGGAESLVYSGANGPVTVAVTVRGAGGPTPTPTPMSPQPGNGSARKRPSASGTSADGGGSGGSSSSGSSGSSSSGGGGTASTNAAARSAVDGRALLLVGAAAAAWLGALP